MAELNQNTVVFIVNNGNYGFEQASVNPNPYRDSSQKVNYEEKYKHDPDQQKRQQAKILDTIYSYNEVFNWKYEKLVEVMGKGTGVVVRTRGELIDTIKAIKENKDELYIVNVIIDPLDTPSKQSDGLIKGVGEDEVLNPDYPNT